jgi:hypothetical protein
VGLTRSGAFADAECGHEGDSCLGDVEGSGRFFDFVGESNDDIIMVQVSS